MIIQAKPGFHETLEYLLDIRQGAVQDLAVDAPVVLMFEGRQATMRMVSAGNYVNSMPFSETLGALVTLSNALGATMQSFRTSVSRFERSFCLAVDMTPAGADEIPEKEYPGEFGVNVGNSAAGRMLCGAACSAYATKEELSYIYDQALNLHSVLSQDEGINVLRHSKLNTMEPIGRAVVFDLCASIDYVVDMMHMLEGAIDYEVVLAAARNVKSMCEQLLRGHHMANPHYRAHALMAATAMAAYATAGFIEFANDLIVSVFFFIDENEEDFPGKIVSPRLTSWSSLNAETDYPVTSAIGQVTFNNVIALGEWILSYNWSSEEVSSEVKSVAPDLSDRKANNRTMGVTGAKGHRSSASDAAAIPSEEPAPKRKPSARSSNAGRAEGSSK